MVQCDKNQKGFHISDFYGSSKQNYSKPHLTFKGRMLTIGNASCTPHWPNVSYSQRCARMKFFSSHGVYSSKKPKQTNCACHNKVWYSSGAMMSFMAVWVSILFLCTLDLWASAEGVNDTTQ